MINLKKEFLRLHIIRQLNYKEISERLNVPNTTLSNWYEELRTEREIIAKIRTVWTKKKFTPNFEDFYDWYLTLEQKCEYCGITEVEIKKLLEDKKLYTKRIDTRGKKLEFDRKTSNESYDNIDNIVLACYWCNNAKTDTFTYDEFKKVGRVFADIWKNRINQ